MTRDEALRAARDQGGEAFPLGADLWAVGPRNAPTARQTLVRYALVDHDGTYDIGQPWRSDNPLLARTFDTPEEAHAWRLRSERARLRVVRLTITTEILDEKFREGS